MELYLFICISSSSWPVQWVITAEGISSPAFAMRPWQRCAHVNRVGSKSQSAGPVIFWKCEEERADKVRTRGGGKRAANEVQVLELGGIHHPAWLGPGPRCQMLIILMFVLVPSYKVLAHSQHLAPCNSTLGHKKHSHTPVTEHPR